MSKEFTMSDAIAIQHEQLLGWKKILKPECYEQLRQWCNDLNKKASAPTHVKRGVDMDNFVHNTLIRGHEAPTY